MPFEEEFD